MRILLVHDYANLDGGAEIMTNHVISGLRDRGHDVRLFSTNAGGGRADYTCFGTTSPLRTLLQTHNPDAARRLRHALADFHPDVVHVRMFLTQLSPSILEPLRGAVPALYHAVWYEAVCPKGTKMLPDGRPCVQPQGAPCRTCVPLHRWLPLLWRQRRLQSGKGAFQLIVANSHHLGRQLEQAGLGPVEVLWNSTAVVEPRPALTGDRPEIFFAGRLTREKGVDLLIDAFQRMPDFPDATLVIAGSGPEEAGLRAQAQGNPRIRFLGRVPHDRLHEHTGQAWVQVAPGRWAEPFGLVAAEAMMRGLAVVAADSGGFQETVVHGETGLLFEPGNPEALEASLREILSNRSKAESYGAAGRARALQLFRDETFFTRLLEIYQRVIRLARAP